MSFKSKTPFFKSKPFITIVSSVAIIAVVAAIFFFTSGKDESKETTTSTTTQTTVKPKKNAIAPLTGLVDEEGLSATRPALAVKIGNNPEARPQAGLNEADIIYEEIVEGGITRYMAIFNSQSPTRVGPVRSVRGMDPNIALNWGGVFAYSGGAAKNEQKIKSTKGILALNETAAGNGMKRDSARSAPNNLYAIPAELFTRGGVPVPPVKQFKYSEKESVLADLASSFVVGFKSGFACTWKYDAAKKTYARSYGTKPVVDQAGEQVAVENVVVQFIEYPAESEGITIGTGDVWVFRNGKVIKGTWERKDNSTPATFKDVEGNVITLLPGQTWVELASKTTPVTITP